jgi:ABC-type transport system involved in multi-copper enzyme maturation permease subunit
MLSSVQFPVASPGATVSGVWKFFESNGLITPALLMLGLVVVGCFALFLVLSRSASLGSTTGVIMAATLKEAVRQPVFPLVVGLAVLLTVINTYVPFFTLGEDVKMLKDCGLATILIAGLLLATWTASMSIAEEIEGKTAMTLLSKPVNRLQFILGKYLGILLAVLVAYLPMVLTLCACAYYKVFYDARESSEQNVNHAGALVIMLQVMPGVALSFLETAVMTAISVAISTRLPMVVNMVSCLTIFVIGHLTPALVAAGVFKLELVEFMANLLATILPALDIFNIQAAVATGKMVPPQYLGLAALYCVAYSAAGILAAFLLFEDRDLA